MTRSNNVLLFWGLGLTFCWLPIALFAAQIAVEVVMPPIYTHPDGDRNIFASQFDYSDGRVVTAHVESASPQGRTGTNLQTVIRLGQRQPDSSWVWTSKIIESRTILDKWHTQASVAFDRNGYVHVAYNMHNMPWQYAVSVRPFDIDSFSFKGMRITQQEIDTVKFENKTPFPDLGHAAIPGNQITYPMFFKSRRGDLYVTYRFALKPARPWTERTFAAGIAKYQDATGVWEGIGGNVAISSQDARLPSGKTSASTRAFAAQDGFTAYLPTLSFAPDDTMHITWSWRRTEAGEDTTRPSHIWTKDGQAFFGLDGREVSLPLRFDNSPPITGHLDSDTYYATRSLTIGHDGAPIVNLHRIGRGREIWAAKGSTDRFTVEPSPAGASTIVVDRHGAQWAFATGLRVFRRPTGTSQWEEIGQIGVQLCDPKVLYFELESRFMVHAKSCNGERAQIFTFRR